MNDNHRTVENKDDTGERSADERPKHVCRLPGVQDAAPRETHEEEEQSGDVKDDADKVELLEFLPARTTTIVKLVEVGRMVEDGVADQGDAI